jgi:hypothetical protein
MTLDYNVIDLPRSHWRLLPPSKKQVFITLAGVIVSAIIFGIAG